ncbi:cytochrome P450 [Pontibacter sp. G13]|uniref:cytochrome P450 n=1 Tax=Pontibacter sp. G13 TaxID=3074898 RepID=UPI00288B16A7|nr:cytochrome P450 [Pontibacter sp. G13]WNJ20376.1 cytochrome P450 [Pontibacter sp. G13]
MLQSANAANHTQHAPTLRGIPAAPSVHWLLKGAPSLKVGEMHQYFLQCHRSLGDIVDLNLPFSRVIVIGSPALAKELLTARHGDYRKDFATRTLSLALGNGLLTSEGSFWAKQRRIAQPAFKKSHLAQLANLMVEATDALLSQWESRASDPLNISEEMHHLTASIAAKTLFGYDPSDVSAFGPFSKALHSNMTFISNRFGSLVKAPSWLPIPSHLRFFKNQRLLDRQIFQFIEDRKQSGRQAADLLGMLLESKDEDTGAQMTPQQLRDECMTLFAAGQETSGNGLAWTMMYLAQHDQYRQQVRAEVKSVLANAHPRYEDLQNLPFLKQVVEESMRLRPPAWAIGREAIRDTELGEYRIPKGAQVLVSIYTLHLRGDIWESPENFQPERFSKEETAKRARFSYLPFGAGPRMCIGNHFAMMEMQLALAMIVQRFDFEMESAHSLKGETRITLRPETSMKMNLKQIA